jgi:uncharacterized protein with GYD domain
MNEEPQLHPLYPIFFNPFRRAYMSAYLVLVNFTEQGVRGAKDTVTRARAFEKALQSVGGRKIGMWWLLGQYDLMVIAEAPDDATVTRLLLATGALGNVRTITSRAFSEDEMEKIVAGL